MSTDGRLTRALTTRDLAVYYLSSLVGVGVLDDALPVRW